MDVTRKMVAAYAAYAYEIAPHAYEQHLVEAAVVELTSNMTWSAVSKVRSRFAGLSEDMQYRAQETSTYRATLARLAA